MILSSQYLRRCPKAVALAHGDRCLSVLCRQRFTPYIQGKLSTANTADENICLDASGELESLTIATKDSRSNRKVNDYGTGIRSSVSDANSGHVRVHMAR